MDQILRYLENKGFLHQADPGTMSNGAVILQGNFPIPEERRDQLQQLATESEPRAADVAVAATSPAPRPRRRRSIPAFQDNLLGGAGARAACAAAAPAAFAPAPAAAAPLPTLTIISASHTGNGRKISEKLLAAVQALGMQARMVKAGDYQPREIAKEKLLYVVISTHGDGDPPDEARGLYEFLGTKRAPQLPELQYSVLALGDSSYPKFCEAGRVVDERLAKLGAKRLLPRVDCDVDFEKLAHDLGRRRAGARARDQAKSSSAGGAGCHRCRSRCRAGAGGRRADARAIPPPPKCWPTSASSAAARCAKCATWNSRSPASAISTSRATRWASCIAIRIRPSTRCSKATRLDAAPRSRTTARRTRCSNGCATSAS